MQIGSHIITLTGVKGTIKSIRNGVALITCTVFNLRNTDVGQLKNITPKDFQYTKRLNTKASFKIELSKLRLYRDVDAFLLSKDISKDDFIEQLEYRKEIILRQIDRQKQRLKNIDNLLRLDSKTALIANILNEDKQGKMIYFEHQKALFVSGV